MYKGKTDGAITAVIRCSGGEASKNDVYNHPSRKKFGMNVSIMTVY